MCGSCDNLDDDMGDIFGAPMTDAQRDAGERVAQAFTPAASYEERCKSCSGRGRFISYAGRDCGPCFKCKGKGKLLFKSSPEARAKGRSNAAASRDRKQAEARAAAIAWAEANPEDAAWIKAKEGSFDFATAMAGSLDQYGRLTDRQHETVKRLRNADEQRNIARAAEREAREASAPAVDVSQIETAFENARDNGIKRPKMKLAGYKFSMAPATGRNAGSLYVVRVEDDQYLGKITDGKFVRVRECGQDEEREIVAAASDPHKAAIAYGQRTGNCAICSRELTNHASIDLGIGPICAEKYGWA